MKHLYLIAISSILTASIMFFCAPVAMAQNQTTDEMGKQLGAAAGGAGVPAPVDPRATAISIIRVLLTLTGTIVFVIAVYAGFTWMTAGGDEEKITHATALLRNCVIGLAIIMTSYAITLAIANISQGYPINYGTNQYQKIIVK